VQSSFWQRQPRREFLQSAGALAAGMFLFPRASWAEDAPQPGVIVPGKDPRLLIFTQAPAVAETPVDLLAGAQITPMPLLFVRNNSQPGNVATIKPVPAAGWKIELGGMVDKPVMLDAATLADMEQVEYEMVLQCSGNSRALFSAAAQVAGTPWGRGAMGNVKFAGVPLAKLLDRAGVRIKPGAKYLTADGTDEPPANTDRFQHSIPLDEALGKSIVALSLNGAPLPAIHGGPVRLITPGYYGTMHMKWLRRLRFTSDESNHSSQIPLYRTPLAPIAPGTKFDATYANSEPNYRMRLKSVVLLPSPGAKLSAGEVNVAGVAFNDGEAKVDQVLVSVDHGNRWQRAQLEVPDSPYAWYRWQATVSLPRGKHQVWARAVDAFGRSQPIDGSIFWNPKGYTWNGVEKIDITVG
jgi:DMSO/TMAO reductase YedYZ molybdopterin-dependent catalytic subunit